ncbi:phospholipase D delta isoform X2 [Medicago truncatula]|uniref:phospholipase D delta isoform X2 n=1 Tax=Medicago truncatula TaxID=3880 RepID=UPI000D2F1501|nr:phospholipase D delta isoform X2 [Medicago truncatula]
MAETGGEVNGDGFTYLHGDLDLTIISARRLPNMDMFSERFCRCITACDTIKFHSPPSDSTTTAADGGTTTHREHHHRRKIIRSDPYVTVSVPQATVARTRVLKNSLNPEWKERFHIPLAHPVIDLEIRVKDDDVFGAEVMGMVKIPAKRIATGELISGWFPIVASSGKPPKPDTALNIEMKFTPVDENPLYLRGIAADPEHGGVRHTYFPVRKGSSVRLYQDAHCPEGTVPEIQLDNGKVYRAENCWEDICYAITEAHHMVYLAGWSIYDKVKLVREPSRPLPKGGDLTLGDLLKYKSEEGVRVLLLVWDDKTSHDKLFFKTTGVMETHDEETRKFFKHSSVMCVLAPRYASSKMSFIKQQVVGTVFTHHQKCVIVDAQAAGNNRRVATFIGGLDLCDGRYDTPEHRLFRDLDTVFAGDFHNPTFPIFRSIDSGSLKGFPKRADQALSQNLICAKNLTIEKSIQTGYIQAIRSAQHFIYIENQYFIGSSYAWPSYNNAGADNLIPMELALKIASKIKAKERFAIYIVLPMWPEGDPKSGAVQEILFWQAQTMQMMYNVVAKELKSMQLSDVHPQDYLNFYCLGNREHFNEESSGSNSAPVSGAFKYRRNMIYVHAKGMIVDDEYVILGSANINQRSMAGTKDTEIAMGSYQPHYTWSARKKHPHGQIYGYRMSLWAEHLGMLDETFKEPERLECVRKVNEIADDNWRKYASEEMSLLQGHLLKYPVQIDSDGQVSSLPDCDSFPDAGGKILGAHSATIPDILTT